MTPDCYGPTVVILPFVLEFLWNVLAAAILESTEIRSSKSSNGTTFMLKLVGERGPSILIFTKFVAQL